MSGAKLVKVPLKKENNYQIDMDDLKAAVTDKTNVAQIKRLIPYK